MSDTDLFTVKVFRVPKKDDVIDDSSDPEQAKQDSSNSLGDVHLIEEHHNMTSARVIRGKMVELQHSNLVGQSVKFKTILNFERSLDQDSSLGVLLSPQNGYIAKLEYEENV